MTPFWDPNFTPPCGQLAAPYLYAHNEPGPSGPASWSSLIFVKFFVFLLLPVSCTCQQDQL